MLIGIFYSQIVESSSLVSVLFREAISHPYISFFHLLVNVFSIIYIKYISIKAVITFATDSSVDATACMSSHQYIKFSDKTLLLLGDKNAYLCNCDHRTYKNQKKKKNEVKFKTFIKNLVEKSFK